MTLSAPSASAAPELRSRADGWSGLARYRTGGRPVLLAAAGLVSALALLPLGFILWVSVQTGWETIATLVFRPRVGQLLLNTLGLVVCALPPSIALALAMAWATERTDLPGARFWAWLAAAPLAVPAFVQSYSWISLFPGLEGLPAATLLSVLAYFPFLYLPVAAQLRRLDPALEEAAAASGLSPARILWRVVLPQLRLAICGGSLLVALHLLAEYGLYVMIRFDTFTTAIVDQFQTSFDGPAANMLAGVLMLLCLGLVLCERAFRGSERYARVGSGAARAPKSARLGAFMPVCVLGLALVAALSLGVPILTLARWLSYGGWSAWPMGEIGTAFGTTLLLALAGGCLATLAALPVAWLSLRAPGRLVRAMEAAHYSVASIPGVVIALTLVAVTVRVALPLYQTAFTLLVAYALMFLPRALVAVRPSLAQAPIQLEEAAQALGRTPSRAILEVTLRLAAPGLAASMALAGLGIATELTGTLLLAPNGTETLATRFWTLTSEIDYVAAAPYALLMVLISLPLTVLVAVRADKARAR
ncbi:ABC transporter permease [Aureimonas sp. AU40]|uniref:ABC transporter permease n=1 Tax=Aureimonas sp. AU40 TaxID=1637747 RepID=UPI0009EC9B4F|nr:iron ABC transporter permease [Aureimonas sp. AU40]